MSKAKDITEFALQKHAERRDHNKPKSLADGFSIVSISLFALCLTASILIFWIL